jgi:hypothetical protein
MNTQLVDSLVQTVLSLSAEERQLFVQRLQAMENPPSKPQPIDWRTHPFFGLWKDRKDMEDSTEWVRNLRRTEWERGPENE